MIARFLLLLAVLAGLAFGAGPAFGTGGVLPVVKACGCCPVGQAMDCCDVSHVPVSDGAPAAIPLTALELKQALAPLLVHLGFAPQLSVAAPSIQRQTAAQRLASRRLALLCTRLI